MVFVGGGLAATLLLNELRSALPGRVAVIEPWSPFERPPVHWSYWSRVPTLYDRFPVGVWRWARVAGASPESIAPFALRLVRSTDVLAVMAEASKGLSLERLRPPPTRSCEGTTGYTISPPMLAPCVPAGYSTAPAGSPPPSRGHTVRELC